MTKAKIATVVGVSALFIAGCSGSEEPQLSLMDDQTQVEIPAHVAELGDDTQMKDFTYVGEGEDFSVFAARDSEDNWCVALYNEPLPDNPEGWHVSASCVSSQHFAEAGHGFREEHWAAYIPHNYCPIISPARWIKTWNELTTTSQQNKFIIINSTNADTKAGYTLLDTSRVQWA